MSRPSPLRTLGVLAFVWGMGGGLKGALRSFDFWLALVVWLLSIGLWTTPKWTDTVISVLPNLLGFTLGGYTVFLGFGSDSFKGAITAESERDSVYLSVSSAFMLFVGVQLFALLYALVAASLYFTTPNCLLSFSVELGHAAKAGGAIGYFIFCYSIALALRAAVRIFRLSRWYNTYLARTRQTL
ncbi:MAG TPA: hypothetical protein VFA35_06330, partial [Burkholderiaceae bacterium]|nr:hypothetical protein [Burkholderiaceae bacterium]